MRRLEGAGVWGFAGLRQAFGVERAGSLYARFAGGGMALDDLSVTLCSTTPVDDAMWSGIKALYR